MTPAPHTPPPALTPPSVLVAIASALLPREDRELLLGDLEDAWTARASRGSRGARAAAAFIFLIEALHAAIARRARGSALPPEPLPRSTPMFDAVIRDIRYGLRGLARNPGFTAVALLSLALGIGFNTAIFTIVNAVLLRPLPVSNPDQLVTIYSGEKEDPYATMSLPDYRDLKERNQTLSGLAGHSLMFASLERDGVTKLILGEIVTANYWDVMGVRPARGRGFEADADLPTTAPTVVISDAFWKRELGAAPDALGRSVRIRGKACTIVGIAPQGFNGVMPGMVADLWVPAGMAEDVEPIGRNSNTGTTGTTRFDRRGLRWMFVKGRMRDGVTVEQVRADAGAIMQALAVDFPDTNEGVTATVVPARDVRLHPDIDRVLTPIAAMLAVAVGLVLLVACANIANMLLARGAARSKEMAIRVAIGAGRGRIVRQLLAENILLSLAGGIVGTGAALWITQMPMSLPLPLDLDLSIDMRVLAFALGLSLATGVVFGLLPALDASRPSLVPALKDAMPAGGRAKWLSLRSLLVVTQVAVSTVLVVAAALLARSVSAAARSDVGFETGGLAYATFMPQMVGYEPEDAMRFYRRAADRLRDVPGVTGVTLAERLPFGINYHYSEFFIDGRPDLSGEHGLSLDVTRVDREYFDTLGVRILEGRGFDRRDTPESPLVAVINQTMARRYWPSESAIGKRLRMRSADGPVVEIVGVSAAHPVRAVGETPRPFVHLSLDQRLTGGNNIVVRGTLPDAQIVDAIRREITALDPRMFFLELQPYAAQVETTMFAVRAGAALLGTVGAVALALAAIGLYGVLAFNVSRRTREIGIRMALGARPEGVLALVMRDAMALVGVGLAVGLALAWAATGALGSLLIDVAPLDPASYAAAVIVLAAAAVAASIVPARRAARLDPLIALRAN